MQSSMAMLEYVKGFNEDSTGWSRYNQGTDGDSLNNTATGVNIVTNRADMRLDFLRRPMRADAGVEGEGTERLGQAVHQDGRTDRARKGDDRHAAGFQIFQGFRQIEDGFRACGHHGDGSIAQFGQIGGNIKRGFGPAMHAANAASAAASSAATAASAGERTPATRGFWIGAGIGAAALAVFQRLGGEQDGTGRQALRPAHDAISDSQQCLASAH